MDASSTSHDEPDFSESEIIDWVNNEQTRPTCSASAFGYVGYAMGLLSSVYMVFLGDDFSSRLGIKSVVWSYILSVVGAMPVSLLFAQVCRRVFMRTCNTKEEKSTRIAKPKGQFWAIKSWLIGIAAVIFSLTCCIPLTYLSHTKFIEKTNLITALIFDVFAFVPRVILVKFSLESLFLGFTHYLSGQLSIQRLSSNKLGQTASRRVELKIFLDTQLRVVDRLTVNEIRAIHGYMTSLSQQTRYERFSVLLSILAKVRVLGSPRNWLTTVLLELLVLFVSFCGSYVMVSVGCGTYQSFFSGFNLTEPDLPKCNTSSFPKVEEDGILSLAWLACISFMAPLNVAIRTSFGRFFLSAQQAARACCAKNKLTLVLAGTNQSNSEGEGVKKFPAYLPIVFMLLAASLAVLSSFPRIELNEEDIQSSRVIKLGLDMVSGICFFSLDFWPLSGWAGVITGEKYRAMLINSIMSVRDRASSLKDKSFLMLLDKVNDVRENPIDTQGLAAGRSTMRSLI